MINHFPKIALALVCLGIVTSGRAQLYNFNLTAAPIQSTAGKGGQSVSGQMRFTKTVVSSQAVGTLEFWISAFPAPAGSSGYTGVAAMSGFGFNYANSWTESATNYAANVATVNAYGAAITIPTNDASRSKYSAANATPNTPSLNTTSFAFASTFNPNGIGAFDVGVGLDAAGGGSYLSKVYVGSAPVYVKMQFTNTSTTADFNPSAFFETLSYGAKGSGIFGFEFKEMGYSSERWTGVPTITIDTVVVPFEPVPEPSTYGLLGTAALVALCVVRRWRGTRTSA